MPRRRLRGGQLQLPQPPAGARQLLLDLGPAGAQGGLVRHLLLQGGDQRDEVVGEQARPGVAEVGLHDLGAAGDLGLAPERLELAADLGGEVGEPGEVRLHRVELAQRLLLALAVLEDAGGLLDEGAALLGARVQDGVELALADDDVHLPADPGVGEQLLDVEQPAGAAVDRVLGAARAEHRAADRHLGVVDGQGAVGVVDREADLGAAERGLPAVPAKMTSSILPPRRLFAPCSPITQLSASTTFDLPEPFGPTTHVMPGSSRSVVADANDLKPRQRQGLQMHVASSSRRRRWRGPLASVRPRQGGTGPIVALRLARLPAAEPGREGRCLPALHDPASPVVRDALLTWLLTRVSVVILAVAGSWLLARGTAGLQPGFVELWDRWDVAVFVKIARFGYLGYPQDYPDTGTAAFFPGLPGALWMVRLITQDWVVAGLLVSLVAGGVAAVALARLAAADHGELVASRSVLYLAVSPFAVFLAAGYSEALFLAFALPAWLAARQRRWLLAGVLGGLAGTVRVTGFFLGAALLVQWLTSGRERGRAPVAGPAPAAAALGGGRGLRRLPARDHR